MLDLIIPDKDPAHAPALDPGEVGAAMWIDESQAGVVASGMEQPRALYFSV